MLYILLTILTIALILFILSMFMQDKFSDLENRFEQLSLTSIKENYQIKKKLQILEEELLINDADFDSIDQSTNTLDQKDDKIELPLFKEIHKMHKDGISLDQISKITDLAKNDIKAIIKNTK